MIKRNALRASRASFREHTLTTGPDGRAVVRVGEDGYIVVEKNSTIEIDRVKDRAGFFRHVTG